MSEVVDLTLVLGGPRATAVPGLPPVELEPVHRHSTHFRSNTRISMPTHVATHVDVPYHFIPDGATVDQVPVDRFVGRGLLLNLSHSWRRNRPIGLEDIQPLGTREAIFRDRIAILYTGWVAREYGGDKLYTENPYMGTDTAQFLVSVGVKAVGVDFPVDKNPDTSAPDPESYPVHRILLGNGVPIIENLVNLDRLIGREFELWALPLKIYRGDGGATRAVARLL